jgi:hypothetical protein
LFAIDGLWLRLDRGGFAGSDAGPVGAFGFGATTRAARSPMLRMLFLPTAGTPDFDELGLSRSGSGSVTRI